MDNKTNIYKSTPEFLKQGFDPFNVQVLKMAHSQSVPATSLFWRLTPNNENSLIVDQLGRVVYAFNNGGYSMGLTSTGGIAPAWQAYGQTPGEVSWPAYLGADPDWGFVEIEATFSGSAMSMNIGGTEYVYDDNYGTITPELEEYQEGEEQPLSPSQAQKMFWREYDGVYYLVNTEGKILVGNTSAQYVCIDSYSYAPDDYRSGVRAAQNDQDAQAAITALGSYNQNNPVRPSGQDDGYGFYFNAEIVVEDETVLIEDGILNHTISDYQP